MEFLDEERSDEDKHSPEDDCAQDPPEQDFVIISLIDLEVFKDKQDNKNVVDRKCILGEVSGKYLPDLRKGSFWD